MLTLAASDVIAASADAASKITLTIFGMQLVGTTEAYSCLYQGQVAATPTTVYTVPLSTTAFIRSMTVVNTDLIASHTFQLFRGGTAIDNQITPLFNLPAGGSVTYEDASGWGEVTIGAGTTLLNDIHTGYSDYSAIPQPSAPATDTLRFHARKVSGRVVPKWTPPSGVDTPFQAALWSNNVVLYTPNTGTTGGVNIGTPWAVGTTIAHPQPTAGAYNQIKRTTSTNVVTTANQVLGVSSIVANAAQFWIGNSAGSGGFFFFSRFGIETLSAASPNATRLFVGLQSGTVNILASNTIPAISAVGLWHDTTDGANTIYLLTKDGTTSTKNVLTGSPTTPYATGQGYDFYMFCKPADSVIYYRLDNINTGEILVDSSVITTIPNNSTFMGVNVGMSNGTANILANTVGIGVNRIYVESDH